MQPFVCSGFPRRLALCPRPVSDDTQAANGFAAAAKDFTQHAPVRLVNGDGRRRAGSEDEEVERYYSTMSLCFACHCVAVDVLLLFGSPPLLPLFWYLQICC